MTKTLLFGATGNLGSQIAKELKAQQYNFTVAVRSKQKAAHLSAFTSSYVIADVSQPESLTGICDGYDTVISAMGKAVSIKDKSKTSFYDIDFYGNSAILSEAQKSGVKKMVYVSAFNAEKYRQLAYFKAHHDFSEKLRLSGINFSIIKPVAIFSAFIDMIEMAEKGQLINIGRGDKTTNPIYEGDLAKICVDSIKKNNVIMEAGGKNSYTRRQLNEIIQKQVNPGKTVKNIPITLFKLLLPCLKIFNKNSYDKFAFFAAVMQHHTVAAPQLGKMSFEDYVKEKVNK
jgi:uncharacterized protein YbjT (DUF2867 family)